MRLTLFIVSIAGAISCIVIYLALTLTPIVSAFIKARAEAKQSGGGAGAGKNRAILGSSNFLEDLAKVIDALAKAGPVLSSLVGSILFLLMAAFAAGLFKTGL